MRFLQIKLQLNERIRSGKTYRINTAVHETKNHYVVGSVNSPVAVIRKRTAYPSTYAKQINEEVVIIGYGPIDPGSHDEFLQITLHSDGKLIVKRDVYATLPIFYGTSKAEFLLSNEYEFVASSLPQLTLNREEILESLIPNPDRYPTLWREIGILGERQILEVGAAGDVHTHLPKPRRWQFSRAAQPTDPRQFKKVLETHLEAFLDQFIDRPDFAFEVSGGLDSAMLPLYAAKTRPYKNSLLGSVILPGNFRSSQCAKLNTLSEVTGYQLLSAPMDEATDYPLARLIRQNDLHHHYCFEEIYTESFSKLAQSFAAQGVRVIAAGIGTDELFENTLSAEQQQLYGNHERERRQKLNYPPFFIAREEHVRNVPDVAPLPLPKLSVSFQGAALARNNIYIAQDIWPISPYAVPELYEWCQGLPAHFRANKNILRAFAQACQFPELIYHPPVNEHFGEFFDERLTSGKYDSIISNLSRDALTEKLGYIDGRQLADVYRYCKYHPHEIPIDWLLYIFAWLNVEINMRVAHAKGQLKIAAA